MPKITLDLAEPTHERLTEIAGELGITTSDLLRRAIGLVAATQSILEEAGDDVYICQKGDDGTFQQQHVISNMLY